MHLNMGGYGIWLWPAYGITGFIFILNIFFACHEKKNIQQNIQKQFDLNL